MSANETGTCSYCGEKVILKDWTLHMKNCGNGDVRTIKCSFIGCSEIFHTLSDRSEHVNAVHGLIKCTHPNCGKLIEPDQVRHHVRNHKVKRGDCDICGKKFNLSSLRHHITRCSKAKEKSDAQLKAPLKRKKTKELHDNFEDDSDDNTESKDCKKKAEKKFKCDFDGCTSVFTRLSSKRIHIDTIHAKPLPCPHQGCGLFIKKNNLTRHLTMKHPDTRLTCCNCGTQIPMNNLAEHKKSCKTPPQIHNIKTINVDTLDPASTIQILTAPSTITRDNEVFYRCSIPECNLVFKSNDQQKAHVLTHHMSLIPCPQEKCNTFMKPSSLPHHLQDVHGFVKL